MVYMMAFTEGCVFGGLSDKPLFSEVCALTSLIWCKTANMQKLPVYVFSGPVSSITAKKEKIFGFGCNGSKERG